MDKKELQQKLGIVFADTELLRKALIHPSYVEEHVDDADESNQRMEFLGDACLNFIVAHELYQRYPDMDEGTLTEVRSRIVRNETLAMIARKLELGPHLLFGRGEKTNQGADRDSNLADAFEALVAALFLDQGYDGARRFILEVMGEQFKVASDRTNLQDPKTQLQELAHSRGVTLPGYRVLKVDGPAHNPTYTVEVYWDGETLGTGRASRKIDAERQAARNALEQLG